MERYNKMGEKSQIRNWAKKERSKLDMPAISIRLCSKLQQIKEYKQAKNVLIFHPLKNEVDLLSLLKDKSKKFFLPKINGNNLLCCPYSEGDKTCLSCFNTCEPLTEPCQKSLIDLAVIPALAVDKNGYRLGYGGGFYDRFLKDFKGTKIICIPSKLVVEDIFPEEHDIKPDIIITEKDD